MQKSDDKDFVIFPSLNLFLRFFASAILISLAYFLQIQNTTPSVVLSFIILIFFTIFNWVRRVKIEKQVYSFIKKLYNMKKLEMRLDSLIKYLTVKADYEDSYIDYIKSSFDTGGL